MPDVENAAVFTTVDWIVIAAYLAGTTVIGAKLAGKQSTIREFFLGGRKLPWQAICGSIIATEISAATFVAVPALAAAEGGNFTYLQLGIGAIVARIIIGLVFVPVYYRKEIYSPYDYMGRVLGPRVKSATTLLFFVGAILGQGARVYITAFLLSGITELELYYSIWIIGLFSVAWTLLGGITTVIWTDVIQFCVLILGGLLAFFFAAGSVPGGLTEIAKVASEHDKFRVFDLSTDLSLEFTLLCGVLAMPFLNLAAFGCDQVMAQRMFCCKSAADAQRAIIWSSLSLLVALLMLCVGVALYAYYQSAELGERHDMLIESNPKFMLPVFIVREIPVGIRAVIVAAVLAAAISSLDSALAALSQTTVSAFKKPVRAILRKVGLPADRTRSDIGLSKVLVVFWGVILCLTAMACIWIVSFYNNAISLALGLTAYTYGALLGIFLLAFLPLNRDDSGLRWAIPMTLLTVFGMSVHVDSTTVDWIPGNWADWVVWFGAAVLLGFALHDSRGDVKRVFNIVVGVLVIVFLHEYELEEGKHLVWAWSLPAGTLMTLWFGYALGEKREQEKKTPSRAKRR